MLNKAEYCRQLEERLLTIRDRPAQTEADRQLNLREFEAACQAVILDEVRACNEHMRAGREYLTVDARREWSREVVNRLLGNGHANGQNGNGRVRPFLIFHKPADNTEGW